MTTRHLIAFAFGLGLLYGSTSRAQILTLNEDRRVSSSAFVSSQQGFDSDQFEEVAPDAGPFDVSLIADAVIPDASAHATGSQISVITATSIQGEGSVTGAATGGETAIAYASAQSNVAIRFSLEQPSTFEITGFLEGSPNTTATLQLSRPFQTLAWFSADGELLEVNHQGTVMEPGTYDLNITCGASAAAGTGEPSEEVAAAYDILFLLTPSTDVATTPLDASGIRAFPNPFHATTRLTLPEGVRAVRVVDASGRLVRTLSASSSVTFDGRDDAGRPLASGIYWVKAVGEADVAPIQVVRLR